MTQSRQRPSDTAMETNVSWAQGGKGPSFPENAEVKSCICDDGPQIDTGGLLMAYWVLVAREHNLLGLEY